MKVQIGDRIRIVSMADNGGQDWQAARYRGKEGEVTFIDDIGQIHGNWGGLALIPGEDEFEIIRRAE